MKSFRSYQLALQFYKEAKKELRLKGTFKDQFERASLSIVLNLAEGVAKPTLKDRKKFYFVALGSLREIQALLDIISNQELIQKADILGAHFYKLCHWKPSPSL